MPRRFTLAGLLMWVAFVALVLAIAVPLWRARYVHDDRNVVISLAVSADGSTAAGMLGDGKVMVWDSSGIRKTTLDARAGWGGSVQLSADGKWAAVGSGSQLPGAERPAGLELWDVAAGTLVRSWPAFLVGAVISPDGTIAAAVDVNSIDLYSSLDGRRLGALGGGRCAAFSPDGKRIAVGTYANGVQIFDTTTRQVVRELSGPGSVRMQTCYGLAWSADGQTLAGLLWLKGPGRGAIQTWHVESGDGKVLNLRLNDSFDALTYLPGGQRLAMGGRSGVKLLDAATLKPLPEEQVEGIAYPASSSRGNLLLTASPTSIDLRDTATMRVRQRLFDGAPPPKIAPGLLGLAAWLTVFGFCHARRLTRLRPRSLCRW